MAGKNVRISTFNRKKEKWDENKNSLLKFAHKRKQKTMIFQGEMVVKCHRQRDKGKLKNASTCHRYDREILEVI